MAAKAPTLAWLLAALTCLLAGMAIVESRHQTVALPVLDPVGVVITVEVAYPPTATSAPTPPPTPTQPPYAYPDPPAYSPTPVERWSGD